MIILGTEEGEQCLCGQGKVAFAIYRADNFPLEFYRTACPFCVSKIKASDKLKAEDAMREHAGARSSEVKAALRRVIANSTNNEVRSMALEALALELQQ